MPEAQTTGMATPGGVGVVIDANGMAVVPQRPYTLIEQWERSFVAEWPSLEVMDASLKANAPEAKGLPQDAPSPHNVFKDDSGRLCRYVIDPDTRREPFVQKRADGTDEVRERLQFRKQYVALSLEAAKTATDRRNVDAGEPETDFWCGYCWIRGGYSPELFAPTAVLAQQQRPDMLVFDHPSDPSDVARLRHEMARVDRTTQPLPIVPTKPVKE